MPEDYAWRQNGHGGQAAWFHARRTSRSEGRMPRRGLVWRDGQEEGRLAAWKPQLSFYVLLTALLFS
jgi:hypothetical protein